MSLQDKTLKYGIIKVTREYTGVEFIESTLSKDEEQMILTLINVSDPNETFSNIITRNGTAFYLQYVGNPEHALIGILLASTDNLTDNLALYPDTKTLNEYLNTHSKLPNVNINTDYSVSDLAELKGLNGLLFATLTGSPIIALSNEEQRTKKLFLALLSLLPSELAKNTLMATYTESFSDDFKLIGMPTNQETEIIVEQHMDKLTIVDFENQEVFSLYESHVTDLLATAIQSNDTAKIIQVLSEIYEQAWRVKEIVKNYKEKGIIQDNAIVPEAADIFHCSNADAEFYILLGNRMLTKPVIKERRIR
ncbi:MAG: hypothetical protein ACFFHV_04830 [Promethearchaeota archaeon]